MKDDSSVRVSVQMLEGSGGKIHVPCRPRISTTGGGGGYSRRRRGVVLLLPGALPEVLGERARVQVRRARLRRAAQLLRQLAPPPRHAGARLHLRAVLLLV